MSRIHEALKKAAKERSAQLVSNESSFLEIATAPEPAPAPPARETAAEELRVPPPVRMSVLSESVSYLRYEDLAKRCSRPKWKIDGRLSVFEGGDEKHVGAETFRTLRSRLYQIA